MRTEQAIRDLAVIRHRLGLIDTRNAFRCFSLVTSACLFVLATAWQPMIESTVFVGYWFVVSLVCLTGIVAEVWWRSRSADSRITMEWSRQLASSMAPSMSVAAVVTCALIGNSNLTQLLPGIWALMAGLAIANSARLLPARCQIAAFWLIGTGAFAIRFHEWCGQHLSLTMAGLFGLGQLLLAYFLFAGVNASNLGNRSVNED